MHIPEQSGHRFHVKLDGDSISFRTPIPFESGHSFQTIPDRSF
ncbi:MAG: hypothetical protein ACI8PB_004034, partial [Desulforhopalus sp.]